MGETPNHLSPIFVNNTELFPDSKNIIQIPYSSFSNVTATAINTTSVAGYDWTKPFPGRAIDGHEAHLYVTRDVPLSDDIVQNSTTTLSALTFSIPGSMTNSSTDLPLKMDPSWYICRHIFISTKERARTFAVEGKGCDFLETSCRLDLVNSLTKRWGSKDGTTMCSSLALDPIPSSCSDTFGLSRQDVLAFNSTTLADPNEGPLVASDRLMERTWRMGTGYYDPHDPRSYEIAANRTYLIATVWGYSREVDEKDAQTPQVSLSCLSAWSRHDSVLPASPLTSTTAHAAPEPSSTSSSAASRNRAGLAQKLVAAAVAVTAISLLNM